jgi:hypothetical protein
MSLFIIIYCGFDGVFREDRAVDFDWGECKFFCDFRVSEFGSLVKCFPFDPFSDKT